MSELIQKNDSRAAIRWKLLTGASALALTAYVSSGAMAMADDSDRPQVWIELGGQLSRLEDGQEAFSPPNMDGRTSIFTPSQKFEQPPLFSLDENGAISFQPENSDWVFSASIRYGRSADRRNVRQQSNPAPFSKYYITGAYQKQIEKVRQPYAARFADTKARSSEHHSILDFQVGKDVGLGLFGGADASSTVNLGIRFAQFASKSNIAVRSNPDWHFNYRYLRTAYPSFPTSIFKGVFPTTTKIPEGQAYHSNAASLRVSRNFHGIGPSLSWKASAPFAGNTKDGELALDWSVNAAGLFGRQRTKVGHQASGRYHSPLAGQGEHVVTYNPAPVSLTRSRNVMVPNVGGSVGLSYRMDDFKINFGYRVDMFFNAIDGGIDARKNENRGFNGPYASISVGLGD